jgi:predicted TIM-barrel fold metal-dependent hydrolase
MWISTIPYAESSGELRASYDRQARALGEPTEMTRAGSLHPPLVAARLDLYAATEKCPSRLTPRRFYYDSVNFDPRALELAIDFAGVDRILAGSDYPHQIGSIPRMLQSLNALPVSSEDRAKILGGNAANLLGLEP